MVMPHRLLVNIIRTTKTKSPNQFLVRFPRAAHPRKYLTRAEMSTDPGHITNRTSTDTLIRSTQSVPAKAPRVVPRARLEVRLLRFPMTFRSLQVMMRKTLPAPLKAMQVMMMRMKMTRSHDFTLVPRRKIILTTVHHVQGERSAIRGRAGRSDGKIAQSGASFDR
jgi:hypothetical protein